MPQPSRTEPSQLTILHLVQPVDGGVPRVVTDLVRAHTAAGVRAVVACPADGELAGLAGAAGAEVHHWSAARAPGARLPLEVLSAARIVRRSHPDLVHAHSAKAGLVARLAVRGRVPTVFQPHAWSFHAVTGRAARAALAWERYGTRWSTRTLCVSESERLDGERAGIAARWAVIRNGVDLTRFAPGNRDGDGDGDDRTGGTGGPDSTDPVTGGDEDTRAALPLLPPLPAGTPLAVCVGRLCRQKGQDVLLDAWPRVRGHVPGATLVLVGDGPDRARLARTAPPGVIFAGAVADTVPFLRAADVVVLPSRWEGMALAPLEAMACARPVVVTDVSGARESLPPGHDAHSLVPPDDAPALAAAVTALFRDAPLRTALGGQARAHVRVTGDAERTAAAVLGLYQDLLLPPQPLTRKSATR
ncbi:glycosyltransferase family 4 protein [Streptomyces yaizuensis]|uniref:Glycosyltransferase n=1 Tax=Streptomyces yaizuensis TaxID=2989713 RepID=A0ABQ5NVU0_9ACTN|nr:glycosyltransferase family 4 protein [Streptomyces sp. YSPA8]GLF94344.1 glycosyltransferase [Streptomyces sp. YSPA8]